MNRNNPKPTKTKTSAAPWNQRKRALSDFWMNFQPYDDQWAPVRAIMIKRDCTLTDLLRWSLDEAIAAESEEATK